MKIPFVYNARSVLQRPASTAFTAVGIGLVVAVFIGMLALANGFRAALARTGSDENALVLRRGADSELSSGIDRPTATLLASFCCFRLTPQKYDTRRLVGNGLAAPSTVSKLLLC